MHNFISILINKTIYFICKILRKNGDQLPGYFVYDVFKDHKILTRLKYPKYVIAVTGSSGKGSTCQLIKHTLENNNLKVLYNESGNNGVLGIISFILKNTKFNGDVNGDVLLLECDERHLKLIFSKNKPTHLIITNVTRDQPARNGNPLLIFEEINKIIDDDIHLIINGDDPLLSRLKLTHKGQITTYGIGHIKTDYTNNNLHNIDFAYCPICHKKLKYKYYHYGHLGDFICPGKDFERGKVDYEVNNVDLDRRIMQINNNKINLSKGALYICYATLISYVIGKIVNIEDKDIIKALNSDKLVAKRGKEMLLGKRKITMLETKNENNLSYYQSIKYITSKDEVKSIILGFENVSRRYKLNDLSWLYDVDFELLNTDKKIDKIFCIGRFKYDVATRLLYANIPKEKIILVDDVNNLLTYVKKSKGNIYTMVCFDMTAVIRKMIENERS